MKARGREPPPCLFRGSLPWCHDCGGWKVIEGLEHAPVGKGRFVALRKSGATLNLAVSQLPQRCRAALHELEVERSVRRECESHAKYENTVLDKRFFASLKGCVAS
jgi:hypothetical protein